MQSPYVEKVYLRLYICNMLNNIICIPAAVMFAYLHKSPCQESWKSSWLFFCWAIFIILISNFRYRHTYYLYENKTTHTLLSERNKLCLFVDSAFVGICVGCLAGQPRCIVEGTFLGILMLCIFVYYLLMCGYMFLSVSSACYHIYLMKTLKNVMRNVPSDSPQSEHEISIPYS